jgi:hypothetical protein
MRMPPSSRVRRATGPGHLNSRALSLQLRGARPKLIGGESPSSSAGRASPALRGSAPTRARVRRADTLEEQLNGPLADADFVGRSAADQRRPSSSRQPSTPCSARSCATRPIETRCRRPARLTEWPVADSRLVGMLASSPTGGTDHGCRRRCSRRAVLDHLVAYYRTRSSCSSRTVCSTRPTPAWRSCYLPRRPAMTARGPRSRPIRETDRAPVMLRAGSSSGVARRRSRRRQARCRWPASAASNARGCGMGSPEQSHHTYRQLPPRHE